MNTALDITSPSSTTNVGALSPSETSVSTIAEALAAKQSALIKLERETKELKASIEADTAKQRADQVAQEAVAYQKRLDFINTIPVGLGCKDILDALTLIRTMLSVPAPARSGLAPKHPTDPNWRKRPRIRRHYGSSRRRLTPEERTAIIVGLQSKTPISHLARQLKTTRQTIHKVRDKMRAEHLVTA